MIDVRVIVAGETATATIDPAAATALEAVRAEDPWIAMILTSRLAEAEAEGTELTPTGPSWLHRTQPWTDERELAIALAAYLDPDDPLARVLAEDQEIAELVRVPEGAIA